MKLGAVTPVFNEENLITGCIMCLKPFVDRHVICVSERPYFGEERDLDRTADIAEELGACVVKGVWPMDHMQRNTGIAMLQDCDWIICTDVDMWLTKQDMAKLVSRLEKAECDAFIISQHSYWHDVNHVLEGDNFKPVIAVRPHAKFWHIGNIDCPVEVIEDICVHHINWCSPKDIYKKVTTYSHADEFNGEDWYKEKYLKWEYGQKAILPNGEKFDVKKKRLPDNLRVFL